MNANSSFFSKLQSYFTQYHFSGAFLLIGIVIIGMAAFLVQDIRSAMDEAELIYDRSVRGLDLIGELQYQTQEARRNVTYALTTEDDVFQMGYIDMSREADVQITKIIEEHRQLVSNPREVQASQTFERDWANYLSIRMGIKQPYNISVPAQVALFATLQDTDLLLQRVRSLVEERERMRGMLEDSLGVTCLPSKGNFLLCKFPDGQAPEIQAKLAKKGIFVRRFGDERLGDYLRISAGRPSETDALINALKELKWA